MYKGFKKSMEIENKLYFIDMLNFFITASVQFCVNFQQERLYFFFVHYIIWTINFLQYQFLKEKKVIFFSLKITKKLINFKMLHKQVLARARGKKGTFLVTGAFANAVTLGKYKLNWQIWFLFHSFAIC